MSLRRIVLRDFVIVESLDLDLHPGFSVLTGETGAGKSILIDALQLALGGRADGGVVRQGAQRCDIAAEFDAPASIASWLEEQGFPIDDALLLRRTVDQDGRSRAWINGGPATVGQLKALAESLIDIHGQHAWQSLTRANSVRTLLDAFAGVDTLAAESACSIWRAKCAALQAAADRKQTLQQDSDRLTWQIGELEKLSPKPGEWEELNAQHARLANAQGLLDSAQSAIEALEGDPAGAIGLLHRAASALRNQAHIEPAFSDQVEVLESALAQAQDTLHNLHQYARHTELDPAQLAVLDERISMWMSLARRYHRAPEELADLLTQCRRELAEVGQSLDLGALQQAERQAWKSFEKALKVLTQQREAAAPKLSLAVTEIMQTLGMQGGTFEVALKRLEEPQAQGWEQVEFLVAGHAGTAPKPVGKIASGGELSRIALAISVVTSRLGTAPTLIFDEVDSGIGGAVAHTVGQLLRQLGQDRQVLAVTHLPQVAACARQHLLVSKRQVGQQTLSAVAPITAEERVIELARMLGGSARSEVSMAHARELLTP